MEPNSNNKKTTRLVSLVVFVGTTIPNFVYCPNIVKGARTAKRCLRARINVYFNPLYLIVTGVASESEQRAYDSLRLLNHGLQCFLP